MISREKKIGKPNPKDGFESTTAKNNTGTPGNI